MLVYIYARIWTKISRLVNELSENEENLINIHMKQLSNILADSSLSGKREAGLSAQQSTRSIQVISYLQATTKSCKIR